MQCPVCGYGMVFVGPECIGVDELCTGPPPGSEYSWVCINCRGDLEILKKKMEPKIEEE